MAQGPIENCTYTATPCAPFESGPTETITVYEQPFLATSTASFDCQGCGNVTVVPRGCFGPGLVKDPACCINAFQRLIVHETAHYSNNIRFRECAVHYYRRCLQPHPLLMVPEAFSV